MFDPSISASGFLVGLLVGLTGVGGGALMTPLLILVFGVKPTTAVGTDLAYATVTKIVGAAQYARRGNVNYPYIRWLATGSVPAALLSVFVLMPQLERSGVDIEAFTTAALGIMLSLAGAIALLERRFFAGRLRNSRLIRSPLVQDRIKEPILVVGGLLIGSAVGMTSVGSGSLLMAILLLVSELDVLVLIGTDIVHATLLLGAAGIAHFVRGNVEVGMMMTLLVGSVPGIWTGSRLAEVVPTEPLRYLLALLLLLSGLKFAFGS